MSERISQPCKWEKAERLRQELSLQKGANAAQDQRERAAAERLGMVHNCDWPEAVAEEVERLKARVAELEAANNAATFPQRLAVWKALGFPDGYEGDLVAAAAGLHADCLSYKAEQERIKTACGPIPAGFDIDQYVAGLRARVEALEKAARLAQPVLDAELQVLCNSWCPPCKEGETYDYSELRPDKLEEIEAVEAALDAVESALTQPSPIPEKAK